MAVVQRISSDGRSMEEGSDRSPDGGPFCVFLGDELVGTHRRKSEAQKQYLALRDDSDWEPKPIEFDPSERLKEEASARYRLAKAEFWRRSSGAKGYGFGKYKW